MAYNYISGTSTLSMPTPLDDIEYLVRSEHRIRVLDMLAAEPRTRADLMDATGVSRVTMGRMLGDMENKGWIKREGQQYRITSFAQLLADDLDRLLSTAGMAQRLRDANRWLPLAELDIDLRWLSEATVVLPERGNSVAPMDRLDELFALGEQVRILAGGIARSSTLTHREQTVEGTQSFAAVYTSEAIDAASTSSEMTRWFQEIIEADQEIYRYDGKVPCGMGIIDETVVLTGHDGQGGFRALLEGNSEALHSWAESIFQEYKEESVLVGQEAFGS